MADPLFDIFHVKLLAWGGDVLSAVAIVGAILGYMPYIGAAAGFTFYIIQIWESKTLQAALTRWKARRQAAYLAQLRERVEHYEDALRKAQERLKHLTGENGP